MNIKKQPDFVLIENYYPGFQLFVVGKQRFYGDFFGQNIISFFAKFDTLLYSLQYVLRFFINFLLLIKIFCFLKFFIYFYGVNSYTNFIYSKLPQPHKWKFWIGVAIIVKTLFFVYKLYEPHFPNTIYTGTFAIDSSDTISYIEPIENLLNHGTYSDDFRMPGYGWIYFLFRLVFNQLVSLNLLVVFQLLLSSVSVFILALIAKSIFQKNLAFYLTFIIYCISTYVSLFDNQLLTESFCTSAIIFSTWFLVKFIENNNTKNIILSGLMLTWAIFLRPVIFPLLFLFSLYLLVVIRKNNQLRKSGWKIIIYFLLPFFLIDGYWIIRNYQHHNGIYPLTRTIYYPGAYNSCFFELDNFVRAFGGSTIFWQPGAEITFFKPTPAYIKRKIEVKFPAYIYTSKFNYDSLLVLRDSLKELNKPETSMERQKNITDFLKNKSRAYTLSIKKEKPFLYYVSSKFILLKTFFIHSGTYNLFNKASFELNKFEYVIKIFYSMLYLSIVILGFSGCIFMNAIAIKEKDYLPILIALIGLYIAIVFPFLFKSDEARYFVPGYPFFVIASVFVIMRLLVFFKIKFLKNV